MFFTANLKKSSPPVECSVSICLDKQIVSILIGTTRLWTEEKTKASQPSLATDEL